jgi:hypothetical protein
LSLLWVCTSIFCSLGMCQLNVLTIVQAISGKFQGFLRLFCLHFGSRYYITKIVKKMSAICIQFCRLIACEMLDKILILVVKCLKNCLLPQWRTIVWLEFKISTGFLKHIASTIGYTKAVQKSWKIVCKLSLQVIMIDRFHSYFL